VDVVSLTPGTTYPTAPCGLLDCVCELGILVRPSRTCPGLWDSECVRCGERRLFRPASAPPVSLPLSAWLSGGRHPGPAFLVVVRPSPVPATTIHEAAVALLGAGKADPDVTYMPYVVRADGSPLSADENDALDRALGAS
jgi:hypothetical protein